MVSKHQAWTSWKADALKVKVPSVMLVNTLLKFSRALDRVCRDIPHSGATPATAGKPMKTSSVSFPSAAGCGNTGLSSWLSFNSPGTPHPTFIDSHWGSVSVPSFPSPGSCSNNMDLTDPIGLPLWLKKGLRRTVVPRYLDFTYQQKPQNRMCELPLFYKR